LWWCECSPDSDVVKDSLVGGFVPFMSYDINIWFVLAFWL